VVFSLFFSCPVSRLLDIPTGSSHHDHELIEEVDQVTEHTVNVAEAKKHLSELLGRVAYGKQQILITKRGKPLAKLVPAQGERKHLAEAQGWLDEGDEFFQTIETIVRSRGEHAPRILSAEAEDEVPA
jgi:prevent-host-death family protein